MMQAKTQPPDKKPAVLTDVAIKNLKPSEKRREIADAKVPGLRLLMQPTGAKSWALRYRFAGKPQKWTIGGYPAVSIETARKTARRGLAQVALGVDPALKKRSAREEAQREARAVKFEEALNTYFSVHVERNLKPSTAREHKRLLQKETQPWKGRRISDIAPGDVFRLLDAMIARGAPIGANRLHSRLSHFFAWAKSRQLITSNPLTDIAKPSSEKGRKGERILVDWELALVWRAAEQLGFPYAPIIRMLMLTGARRGEVAGMSWAEIDLTANSWTLPKERSKNLRTHALPLAPLARATLNALPRFARRAGETDFCFSARDKIPNDFAKKKLRLDDAVLSLRREIDPDATPLASWVVHDIRRSLISGMARLGVELHVIERVVNHVSGSFGGIVSVYQKHKYEDQMRVALERWAAHIERIVAGEADTNVVELARR